MKGEHQIIVQNRRMRYDFSVKRNITIICGNSATGKTTLVDMIREYFTNGEESGVEVSCDKECAVVEGRTWKSQLAEIRDAIVFIDEGNEFVFENEFSHVIQRTDNYYVLITRESIPSLPYSVDEIYGIRNSGKYGTLRKTYNEFYPLYSTENNNINKKKRCLVVEDSNAGYEFFEGICEQLGYRECISAKGKSNVFDMLIKHKDEEVVVIADGAAFGSEMEKIGRLMKTTGSVSVYLPESFEWLVLQAGIFEGRELRDILDEPEQYIDSAQYFSWERFFTAELVRRTVGTYLQYNKKKLNPVYLQDKLRGKIIHEMIKDG